MLVVYGAFHHRYRVHQVVWFYFMNISTLGTSKASVNWQQKYFYLELVSFCRFVRLFSYFFSTYKLFTSYVKST